MCLLTLISSALSISPSPSPSLTPRPGTIKLYSATSNIFRFKDGSPIDLLQRACVWNMSLTHDGGRYTVVFYLDPSFTDCMKNCLKSIVGKYCIAYDFETWAFSPPETPTCGRKCGAKEELNEVEYYAVSSPFPYNITVYVKNTISPSPSPSSSPSTSSSPAQIFGLPRISEEEDLPELDENQGPEENSQHTTDNLEFYVYRALIRRNPGAGIRSSYSIAQYSRRNYYAVNPSRQLLETTGNYTVAARSVTTCSYGRCSTRVRVWSDNKIGKKVVFRAVGKLRKREGFKDVYTIYWTKIIRRRLSRREWSVEIPFKKSYQRRFRHNNA